MPHATLSTPQPGSQRDAPQNFPASTSTPGTLPTINQLPLVASASQPLSRREARKAKHRPSHSTSSNASITDTSSTTTTPVTSIPNSPRASATIPRTPSMALKPLFIASLGNPAPYLSTLHSAGHLLVTTIQSCHPSPSLFTPFAKSRFYANAHVSSLTSPPIPGSPDDWLFYRSATLMNVSGPALHKSFLAWKRLAPQERKDAVLVVVHDELESELGKVRFRREGSVKGHNGLKSVVGSVGAKGFVRIGVGIGRPASREPDDVAKYVLRKMTKKEEEAIQWAAGPAMGILRQIEEGEI